MRIFRSNLFSLNQHILILEHALNAHLKLDWQRIYLCIIYSAIHGARKHSSGVQFIKESQQTQF